MLGVVDLLEIGSKSFCWCAEWEVRKEAEKKGRSNVAFFVTTEC